MRKENVLLSLICLVRAVIFQPGNVFRQVKKGELQREVLTIFCIAALIPLMKSFYLRRQFLNFFADERLNQLFSALSIPQIKWFVTYLAYFAMICLAYGICRLFRKVDSIRALLLAFMSISSIGIVSQIFFYLVNFVLPKNVMFIGSYCIYFWIAGLSIMAIQITQGLSFSKALTSFLPPAIFFTIICGMAAVSPYLAWLAA